jgi:hypothetical protein
MNGDLSWSLARASRLRPDAPGIVDGSTFIVDDAEIAALITDAEHLRVARTLADR